MRDLHSWTRQKRTRGKRWRSALHERGREARAKWMRIRSEAGRRQCKIGQPVMYSQPTRGVTSGEPISVNGLLRSMTVRYCVTKRRCDVMIDAQKEADFGPQANAALFRYCCLPCHPPTEQYLDKHTHSFQAQRPRYLFSNTFARFWFL